MFIHWEVVQLQLTLSIYCQPKEKRWQTLSIRIYSTCRSNFYYYSTQTKILINMPLAYKIYNTHKHCIQWGIIKTWWCIYLPIQSVGIYNGYCMYLSSEYCVFLFNYTPYPQCIYSSLAKKRVWNMACFKGFIGVSLRRQHYLWVAMPWVSYASHFKWVPAKPLYHSLSLYLYRCIL